jgi:adenine phosphoribosyltransferase
MEDLKKYIREIPDFPKPGVLFYDLTTLIEQPDGFKAALDAMASYVEGRKPNKLVGIEARGFVFGAALADRLNLPLVLARKSGKLPHRTVAEAYELEYGTDAVEVHAESISPGDRIVVVDDLVATGGTLAAVCRLVGRLGAEVVGVSTIVGLTFLPYQDKLADYDLNFLITYDHE